MAPVSGGASGAGDVSPSALICRALEREVGGDGNAVGGEELPRAHWDAGRDDQPAGGRGSMRYCAGKWWAVLDSNQ